MLQTLYVLLPFRCVFMPNEILIRRSRDLSFKELVICYESEAYWGILKQRNNDKEESMLLQ